MTLPRLLLVVLVLTALTAVTAAVVQVLDREPASRGVAATVPGSAPGPDGPGPARADTAGLAVLRGWDERRADAWSRGDPAALGRLYAAGSVAGRRDVAMLRAWTSRGLRVRGLRMQVLALDAVRRRRSRLVLTVTDRLAGAVAVGPGVRQQLPRDRPSTRTVELVRSAGEWRVAAVRPARRPAGQPAR